MPNVISNTSCLIALANIDMLAILQKRYDRIIVTPEVANEFGDPLPDWISIIAVKDVSKINFFAEDLDIGESSVIALASEIDDPLLILDDGKARRYAKNMGLTMTGTLGIIIKSQNLGLVDDAASIVKKLRSIGFRVPRDIENELRLFQDPVGTDLQSDGTSS
jgi:predicted nucleic acid-binding protein